MALAYAPYNESPTMEDDNPQTIEQTRQGRNNKTIKKRPSEQVQKVWDSMNSAGVSGKLYGQTPASASSSVTAHDADETSMADFKPLSSSSSSSSHSASSSASAGDFNPPPKAELSKMKQQTPEFSLGNNSLLAQQPLAPLEDSSDNKEPFGMAQNTSNSLPNTYSNDYYKQYVPYYNQLSQSAGNRDQLLEKLNYMIHLLEEQKDEKTGYVMEEIILFSFLGVFIIFIVDSFARVSKYER